MAEILKQTEETPASYPNTPSGLSDAAMLLNHAALWQRIEGHVAHRWTARQVEWTVRGPGEFIPPLGPVGGMSAEVWDGTAWNAASVPAAPLGYRLELEGPYRISATVGAGPVPAAVFEAFRRLAEYLAETDERPGAVRYSAQLSSTIQESFERYPTWQARALQYSGAADLLRRYRRP